MSVTGAGNNHCTKCPKFLYLNTCIYICI